MKDELQNEHFSWLFFYVRLWLELEIEYKEALASTSLIEYKALWDILSFSKDRFYHSRGSERSRERFTFTLSIRISKINIYGKDDFYVSVELFCCDCVASSKMLTRNVERKKVKRGFKINWIKSNVYLLETIVLEKIALVLWLLLWQKNVSFFVFAPFSFCDFVVLLH